jgi:salicylate hydroxylase
MEVAIIGGGPAGLSAALEMAALPHVNWHLYEKKSQISETGGGMSLQAHIWKLLERNGTAQHIRPTDYFRPHGGLIEQRR